MWRGCTEPFRRVSEKMAKPRALCPLGMQLTSTETVQHENTDSEMPCTTRSSKTMLAASPMLEVGGRTDLDNGMTLRSYASVGATFYGDNEWSTNARLAGAPATAGTFNSVSALPSERLKLNAGVVLGGVSGYEDGIQLGGVQHGIHLAVLPELVLAMRYAEAALIYIPSAAKTPATVAAQLRFKF